jgi:hypothetical protein
LYKDNLLLHIVLPVFLWLIFLLEVTLRFGGPLQVTRIYCVLGMLDVTLQLSDTAIFTQIGQGGTSFVDLFVQLSNVLSNLLDVEPEFTDSCFEARYGIGTVLKLFAAPLSYITESRDISGFRGI